MVLVGTTPTFQVEVTSAARLTPAAFDKRALVVLNDTMFPPAGGGGVMKRFLERVPEYHLTCRKLEWNSSSNFRSPVALPLAVR